MDLLRRPVLLEQAALEEGNSLQVLKLPLPAHSASVVNSRTMPLEPSQQRHSSVVNHRVSVALEESVAHNLKVLPLEDSLDNSLLKVALFQVSSLNNNQD